MKRMMQYTEELKRGVLRMAANAEKPMQTKTP